MNALIIRLLSEATAPIAFSNRPYEGSSRELRGAKPQPVILESRDAMNAVDGATIEPRIRVCQPDEGRGRCKGSRIRAKISLNPRSHI
jgi:hypothetical protein